MNVNMVAFALVSRSCPAFSTLREPSLPVGGKKLATLAEFRQAALKK